MVAFRQKASLLLTAFAFTIAFLLFASTDRSTFVINDVICSKIDENLMKNVFKYKKFCVLPYVLRSEMQRDMEMYNRITLIIHVSADYLDEKLTEQVDSWDGPVSLSVFLPRGRVAASLRKVIAKLNEYKPKIISKLSAHLFFYNTTNCAEGIKDEPAKTPAQDLYPVNVARNVARLLSSTKYILLADYEFLFSNGFEAQMRTLADDVLTKDPKTALVFRIFEFNETIKEAPRKKEHLYKLYKSGAVVEFHAKYYRHGHTIPGLRDWFTRNISGSVPALSAPIPYKRNIWEPQFVSLATIPFHDENFPFPIRDNNVLRWEMCRAKYEFRVVDNVFMVHRGIKTTHGNLLHLKKVAMPLFQSAVRKFAKRMASQYPETNATCPTSYTS